MNDFMQNKALGSITTISSISQPNEMSFYFVIVSVHRIVNIESIPNNENHDGILSICHSNTIPMKIESIPIV